MARPRATIGDVAKAAGVSISTVSHAFSGRRPISPATRERIAAAAAELGYSADGAARTLRTGRSGILGLILRPRDAAHGSHGGTETFTRFAGTVATEALDHKLGLVHVPDILDPTASHVSMDGCIVAFPYGSDGVVGELLRRRLPVVLVDEDPDRPGYGWTVGVDYRHGVRDLLDHLRGQGASRILLLCGTEDNAWNRRSLEAYTAWCRERGVEPVVERLYEGEGREGAHDMIRPLLAGPDRPDAVIAAASRFAAGIADIAADLRLTTPNDLMIAALTDSSFTKDHDPPITAMDLRLEDLGRTALDLLLERLSGAPAPARPAVVTPELRWRASTDRTGTAGRSRATSPQGPPDRRAR